MARVDTTILFSAMLWNVNPLKSYRSANNATQIESNCLLVESELICRVTEFGLIAFYLAPRDVRSFPGNPKTHRPGGRATDKSETTFEAK